MIEKYEIRKINKEERLILYLSINVEFANLEKKMQKKTLNTIINEFILKNNIAFKGKIISLVIGGIFAGNIILNNNFVSNKHYERTLVSDEIVSKLNDDVNEKIVKDIVLQNTSMKVEEKNETNIINNEKKAIKETSIVNNNVKNKSQVVIESENLKDNKDEIINKIDEKETNVDTTINTNIQEEHHEEVDNNIYISLIRNGNTTKIELEEYIVGVVAGEMPAAFHSEALKAQAIISRTYALKANSEGRSLKDNESNQTFKSINELKSLWGNNFNVYYNKIKNAVDNTKGMYLSYNGRFIEAVFHSTSNGKTEASQNVWGNYYPYLVSVASPYDNLNKSFLSNKNVLYSDLSKILGIEVNSDTLIEINSKTTGDRVLKLTINDKEFSGINIRNLLGLRSADFDIIQNENDVTFVTRGYGHGVGLSQYGANGYANNGSSYRDILLHYYPGVKLDKII